MKYMKYFESALKNMQDGDDFDISVHCDVQIFEWLLLYIEFEEKKHNPKFEFYEIASENKKKSSEKKPEISVQDVI